MRKLALLLAVSFVAAGCGSDSSGGGGGGGGGSPTGPTCTYPADSCFVASGATFTPTDLTAIGTACTGSGGTFANSGTCSTASTVTGYCAIPNGAANAIAGTAIAGMVMNGYYYTAAYDAAAANTDCTAIGGTWTGGAPPAVCGNGTVTGSEVCDGTNLNGKTCITQGFTGGTLSCAANCLSFVTSSCTGAGPVCGDNNATGAEVCDGSDLNGASCISQGFTGGTLACAGNCLSFNTAGCTSGGGSCGNGTVDVGEVCDGASLSGASCTAIGFSGGTLSCAACVNFNTSSCTGGPAGWRCDPSYYGTADGCDCGCGIVDPDCGSSSSSVCEFCNDPGACTAYTATCPANINASNNAICN